MHSVQRKYGKKITITPFRHIHAFVRHLVEHANSLLPTLLDFQPIFGCKEPPRIYDTLNVDEPFESVTDENNPFNDVPYKRKMHEYRFL